MNNSCVHLCLEDFTVYSLLSVSRFIEVRERRKKRCEEMEIGKERHFKRERRSKSRKGEKRRRARRWIGDVKC